MVLQKESYTGTRTARVADLKDFIGQVSGVELIVEPEDLWEAFCFGCRDLKKKIARCYTTNSRTRFPQQCGTAKGEEANWS
jgi:hypothetical protein